MEHGKIKITAVKPLEPYKIEVKFNDGTKKKIDIAPILYGRLFSPLRNPELFKHVILNKEVATIEWPNGADFDPETLYNWERYKDELAERAKKWKQSESFSIG